MFICVTCSPAPRSVLVLSGMWDWVVGPGDGYSSVSLVSGNHAGGHPGELRHGPGFGGQAGARGALGIDLCSSLRCWRSLGPLWVPKCLLAGASLGVQEGLQNELALKADKPPLLWLVGDVFCYCKRSMTHGATTVHVCSQGTCVCCSGSWDHPRTELTCQRNQG